MKRIVGIDFGNTLTTDRSSITCNYLESKPRITSNYVEFPNAIRVTKRLVDDPDTKVYIISKVNIEQHRRVIEWIDHNNFYERVGISASDVFFCKERYEKGGIAKDLGITHHIDDRPEVMIYMDDQIAKYLYCPVPMDVVKFFNQLINTKIVNNWLEIERVFFYD